jgi:hypothetical protein
MTRSLTDSLASLVKQVDKVIGENEDQQMAGFVVLLTDDPDGAESELKAFAEKHHIKNVPLTFFDGIAGPESYKVAKDAEVTVMLWRDKKVEANHAFTAGKLDKNGVASVIKDTGKILN